MNYPKKPNNSLSLNFKMQMHYIRKGKLVGACWSIIIATGHRFSARSMALILRLMQLLCLQNMAHICGRLLVLHGLRWNVGNGTRIRFWQDAWVADVGPLVHLAMAPIPEAILHDWVADAIKF